MWELTEYFRKSADEEAFSNFQIKGNEGDFRQDRRHKASGVHLDRDNENGDDSVEAFREGAELIGEQSEHHLKKLREFNGVRYSDADLEATIRQIIEDKAAFASKHGLSEGEADRAEYYALLMQNMTPEQRADYLHELAKTDSPVALAIADNLELQRVDRENNFLQKETTTISVQADQVAAELENPDNQHVHAERAKDPFVLDM